MRNVSFFSRHNFTWNELQQDWIAIYVATALTTPAQPQINI
jgi:hypothetical protein